MLQFKLAFRSYSNVLVFFNVFHDVKEKKSYFHSCLRILQ